MPKQIRTSYKFIEIKRWLTLSIGVVLGILSQHIPEIKSQTDHALRTIENHHLVKTWMNKIGVHFSSSDLDSTIIPSHYAEEQPYLNDPISSFIIHRSGYSLGYDARTRNPAWVYEHLTAQNVQGDVDRAHFTFKEDETLPKHLRATLASYKGQGLDQGHMAPAANHRSSPEEMDDTFYLTNICPQCPQFNREYWSKLEKHARTLTKSHPNVYVVTGPLYLPYQEGIRRFVKYQVIGSDDVAVPSHFFKVITLEDANGKRKVQAYILPNRVIETDTPLDHFRTTIQKVEKAAGLLLFNQPSVVEQKEI